MSKVKPLTGQSNANGILDGDDVGPMGFGPLGKATRTIIQNGSDSTREINCGTPPGHALDVKIPGEYMTFREMLGLPPGQVKLPGRDISWEEWLEAGKKLPQQASRGDSPTQQSANTGGFLHTSRVTAPVAPERKESKDYKKCSFGVCTFM